MSRKALISALIAAAGLALPMAAGAQSANVPSANAPAATVEGVWRNPKNSVHIRIQPCGPNLCGYVVWANANAREDARKGGTKELVGSQLLRNFAPSKTGVWKGKVFIPDLNATFSGTAQLVDDDTLRARGCLFAGLACKAQNWKRVES